MKLISRASGTHILSFDTALDQGHKDFAKLYAAALKTWDWSKVPIREGHTATVWTLKKLPRNVFNRISRLNGPEMVVEAVAWSLQSVTGLELNDAPFVVKHEQIDGSERLTRETLDALYDLTLMGELGERVLEVSKLHPTSGQV